jgi:hypothetical protein
MSSDKEILALEDKRFAAMIGGDWKTVQALAHDQLLYTHSSAVTDTKASWLEFDDFGQDEVQEREFYRPQGAHDRRCRAGYGRGGDRSRDQRPTAQPAAQIPQRLDQDA